MTYKATIPFRAHTLGPSLYGLHGSRCGCGCAGLGAGPITSYFFSETEAAKALAKDYDASVLMTGLLTGAAAGAAGALLKGPVLGIAAGALVGFLVYQTQRPALG